MSTQSKRSDVHAKEKLKTFLESTGIYSSVKITKSPTDIIAVTNSNETHFYEVKFTNNENDSGRCFGAATTKEWECALKNPTRFWFVMSILQPNGDIKFDFLTPEEFMKISFHKFYPQVFFHYNTKNKGIPKDGGVTKEELYYIIESFSYLKIMSLSDDYSI